MNVIDAAQRIVGVLAARLEADGGLAAVREGAYDDAAWLAGELAQSPSGSGLLRDLAAAPGDLARITDVVVDLIARTKLDTGFAEELIRRASPPAAETVRQAATVTTGGVATNIGGDVKAADVRIVGGDDASRQKYRVSGSGTVVQQLTATAAPGGRVRIHVGAVFKRKFFLVPIGFFVRVGRSAGSAAATHPAVAVVTCTVVVAGGAVGAYALANTPPPSLASAPVSFAGLWQGTVSQSGGNGSTTDMAITGGPLQGTVGSVNLTEPSCTGTLTLTAAQQQELTITDTTTSGNCPSGVLVLTPAGPNTLRYVLTGSNGTTSDGVLTRVQAFGATASAQPTGQPSVAYLVGNGVSATAAGTVTALDPETGATGRTITTGVYSDGGVISPDGRTLYLLAQNPAAQPGEVNAVRPLDLETGRLGPPVAAGTFGDNAVITPDGKTLYVTGPQDSLRSGLFPVDLATGTVGAVIGAAPGQLVISPDGKTIYDLSPYSVVTGASAGQTSVDVIGTATDTVTKTIAVAGPPGRIVISPDGKMVYTVSGGGGTGFTVTPIDTSTNTVGPALDYASSSNDNSGGGTLAISPDGRTLVIGGRVLGQTADGSLITLLDLTTKTFEDTTLSVLGQIAGIDVSSDNRTIYVVSYGVDTGDPTEQSAIADINLAARSRPGQPRYLAGNIRTLVTGP